MRNDGMTWPPEHTPDSEGAHGARRWVGPTEGPDGRPKISYHYSVSTIPGAKSKVHEGHTVIPPHPRSAFYR
jgi:hypothetical protein